MDVRSFVESLLAALSASGMIGDVDLQVEGPVASGRAHILGGDNRFLRFFFNQKTGTIAFALISGQKRLWGVDRDNRRGWHLHPVENPNTHIPIEPLSISEIIQMLHNELGAEGEREIGEDS